MWITNGAEAGLYIVMANVDPSKGYKGITAFLCEKGMEGISVGKKEDKLGIRASSTTPITFDQVSRVVIALSSYLFLLLPLGVLCLLLLI